MCRVNSRKWGVQSQTTAATLWLSLQGKRETEDGAEEYVHFRGGKQGLEGGIGVTQVINIWS